MNKTDTLSSRGIKTATMRQLRIIFICLILMILPLTILPIGFLRRKLDLADDGLLYLKLFLMFPFAVIIFKVIRIAFFPFRFYDENSGQFFLARNIGGKYNPKWIITDLDGSNTRTVNFTADSECKTFRIELAIYFLLFFGGLLTFVILTINSP